MNSKAFSVIVCDLDGTLLSDSKVLSQTTVDTLIKAQKQGYTLVLATGRGNAIVDHFVDTLEMKKYNGYVLTFNGQQVRELATNTIHQQAQIPAETIQAMAEFAQKENLQVIIENADNYLVYTPKKLKWLQRYVKLLKWRDKVLNRGRIMYPLFNQEVVAHYAPILNIDNPQDFVDPSPKIGISQTPQVLGSQFNKLQAKFVDDLVIMQVAPTWLDVTLKEIDKAKGLAWISERLKTDLSKFIAFGDSENDIEMLQQVGISYAMKNAMNAAKMAADHVTSHTNNEDGVSIELEKYL